MIKKIAAALSLLGAVCFAVQADEFDQVDLDRWQQEYNVVVGKGEKLFHGGLKSRNTVSCDQCHPNGANTHPETYPRFQQQPGRVVVLGEMINWCIMNPLESEPLVNSSSRRRPGSSSRAGRCPPWTQKPLAQPIQNCGSSLLETSFSSLTCS